MPTSSIFTNFVIEGEEQIEKFINALEESERLQKLEKKKETIKAKQITDPEELRELMRRRKGYNMYDFLVLDLDGTLAKENEPIKESTLKLLEKIKEKGTKIAICSEKPISYMEGLLRQVGLKDVILIGENGATFKLINNRYVQRKINEESKIQMDFLKHRLIKLYSDRIYFQPNEVAMTIFYRDEEMREEIEKRIEEWKELLTDVKFYKNSDFLNVLPNEINKETGLLDVCRLSKLNIKNTISISDKVNDIPMFKNSGFSIGVNIKDNTDKYFSDIDNALCYVYEFLLRKE